ncbi:MULTISPECIES: ATP synthase subunit I [unclassified Agarivorans]|uniref:ATP synthase subunit I n=1 Tax=unclassified Agarivorans TaxID=2636026 RepID=UPI003D7C5B06
MSGSLTSAIRRKALYYVIFQTSFVVLLTLNSGFFFNKDIAISVLLGGIIFLLPNSLFTLMAFRFVGATKQKQVVTSFYLGEVVKLSLIAILFVLVFTLLKVEPLALLLGFVLSSLTQWTASIFLTKKNRMINGC